MAMPRVDDALLDWMQDITLIRISQIVNSNRDVEVTETPIKFQGTIQPLMPKKLILNSEGGRFWAWQQIHTPFELGKVIDDNDLVSYKGRKFKVMLTNDYSLNGYLEYHLVEAYA
ncbi:MAG: hypothetical protein ACRC6O_13150 [Flavobacterium sp.]